MGYFGTPSKIHTLWLKLSPEIDITKLATTIDSETLEFSSSDQEFISHLTLGRINKTKNIKMFKDVIGSYKIEKLKFEVTRFYLIQSTLTKDGPQYKILEEYSL